MDTPEVFLNAQALNIKLSCNPGHVRRVEPPQEETSAFTLVARDACFVLVLFGGTALAVSGWRVSQPNTALKTFH